MSIVWWPASMSSRVDANRSWARPRPGMGTRTSRGMGAGMGKRSVRGQKTKCVVLGRFLGRGGREVRDAEQCERCVQCMAHFAAWPAEVGVVRPWRHKGSRGGPAEAPERRTLCFVVSGVAPLVSGGCRPTKAG